MIPQEWHKEPAFNCLTDEQWELFRSTHEVGDTMWVDDHECECETFILDGYHRCSCGNRRCCIVYIEGRKDGNGLGFFKVEAW